MRSFEIRWPNFFDYLPAWEAATRTERLSLLEASFGSALDQTGLDVEKLLKLRLVERYATTDRIRIHVDFRQPHKALKAMHRHPLTRPDPEALAEYLTEHLNTNQRAALLGESYPTPDIRTRLPELINARFLKDFLDCKNVSHWENQHTGDSRWGQPEERYLSSPQVGQDLRALLTTLAVDPQPIGFAQLAERVAQETAGKAAQGSRAKSSRTKRSPAKTARPLPTQRLGSALMAGLRYALCYPSLDEELRPRLGLWPSLSERLHAQPAAEPKPIATDAKTPWCNLAWGLEDLVQLLIRCAEPLRVTGQGRLFVKDHRDLLASFDPLPNWVIEFCLPDEDQDLRVAAALEAALELEFVEATGIGKGARIVATKAGWAWLERSHTDRLAHLLDVMRPVKSPSDRHLNGLGLLATTLISQIYVDPKLEAQALATLKRLKPGVALDLRAFASYESEQRNPLLSGRYAPSWRQRGTHQDESYLEQVWANSLVQAIVHRLVPYGCVRLALDPAQGMLFEPTQAFEYLVQRSSTLSLPERAESSQPALIQPDFEVIFVTRSPHVEAAYARFAERLQSGVGTLFRITPASIQGAARAGLSLAEIESTLTDSSASALPKNVAHEIRGWHAQTLRLALQKTLVIRCPDPESAARILAAAGSKLELLGETTLLLADPSKRAQVIRSCQKKGIFLDFDEPVTPPKPKRRRRRGW